MQSHEDASKTSTKNEWDIYIFCGECASSGSGISQFGNLIRKLFKWYAGDIRMGI